MTFRQRLRAKSEEKLVEIVAEATTKLRKVATNNGLKVGDLAKLCSPGEHKTIFDSMVTQLANNTEADLEKIYNNQMGFPLGGDDG